MDDRQATFEQACRNAAAAVAGNAQRAVEHVWQEHQDRGKALSKLNAHFALDMVKGSLAITASAGAAAAHAGVLPLSIASIVKTAGVMGLQIKDFVAGADAAAKQVIALDATLARASAGEGVSSAVKSGARELGHAVGVPIASVHGMEEALEKFRGKSRRTERTAQQLYQSANKTMSKLEALEAQVGKDPARREALDAVKQQVGGLLDQVGSLMERVKADESFYEVHKERCHAYRDGLGSKLKSAVKHVGNTRDASNLVSTTKTLVEVTRMLTSAFT
jgi:hypothetical protein